jgi:hypothetical protein
MPATTDGITVVELDAWLQRDIRAEHIALVHQDLPREVKKGFTAEPIVITDNVRLRNYLEVKPFGKIEFARRTSLRAAVAYAYAELVRLSPIGPAEDGHYRDSHVILVDGVGIAGGRAATLESLASLDRLRPGAKVQIVNTMPYARKIEGGRANRRKGWKGRRGLSKQAPSGVYRKVVVDVTRRYGASVFVDFRLETLQIDATILKSSKAQTRGKGGFYTYPVLQFLMKKSVW